MGLVTNQLLSQMPVHLGSRAYVDDIVFHSLGGGPRSWTTFVEGNALYRTWIAHHGLQSNHKTLLWSTGPTTTSMQELAQAHGYTIAADFRDLGADIAVRGTSRGHTRKLRLHESMARLRRLMTVSGFSIVERALAVKQLILAKALWGVELSLFPSSQLHEFSRLIFRFVFGEGGGRHPDLALGVLNQVGLLHPLYDQARRVLSFWAAWMRDARAVPELLRGAWLIAHSQARRRGHARSALVNLWKAADLLRITLVSVHQWRIGGEEVDVIATERMELQHLLRARIRQVIMDQVSRARSDFQDMTMLDWAVVKVALRRLQGEHLHVFLHHAAGGGVSLSTYANRMGIDFRCPGCNHELCDYEHMLWTCPGVVDQQRGHWRHLVRHFASVTRLRGLPAVQDLWDGEVFAQFARYMARVLILWRPHRQAMHAAVAGPVQNDLDRPRRARDADLPLADGVPRQLGPDRRLQARDADLPHADGVPRQLGPNRRLQARDADLPLADGVPRQPGPDRRPQVRDADLPLADGVPRQPGPDRRPQARGADLPLADGVPMQNGPVRRPQVRDADLPLAEGVPMQNGPVRRLPDRAADALHARQPTLARVHDHVADEVAAHIWHELPAVRRVKKWQCENCSRVVWGPGHRRQLEREGCAGLVQTVGAKQSRSRQQRQAWEYHLRDELAAAHHHPYHHHPMVVQRTRRWGSSIDS